MCVCVQIFTGLCPWAINQCPSPYRTQNALTPISSYKMNSSRFVSQTILWQHSYAISLSWSARMMANLQGYEAEGAESEDLSWRRERETKKKEEEESWRPTRNETGMGTRLVCTETSAHSLWIIPWTCGRNPIKKRINCDAKVLRLVSD